MSAIKLTLFSQVLGLIDRTLFQKVVRQYDTDKHHKGINTWTHLVSMLFMQIANAGSLRDISHGLRSATGNLSHLGISKAPCKSSLSYQNKVSNYEVFRDLYFALLDKLEPSLQRKRMYASRLKRKIFIMDASIIPLCLSLFDWARFRTTKGGIKLHTVVDYDTGLPCYSVITESKRHEIQVARPMVFPPDRILDWIQANESLPLRSFALIRFLNTIHESSALLPRDSLSCRRIRRATGPSYE